MNDLYIVDQPALVDFCAHLQGVPWLALDTEFIREQTYYSQLGLIQVASPAGIAIIDPLALPSLDPFLRLLYDPAVTKLLHAGQQDLEIFFHRCGAAPSPIFDTQLAALVLGQGDQIGYAALVQRMLGVALDKAHTRADWQRRPLNPEWLAYAADDVRYLPELYRQQQATLVERGWLEALAEDFARLCHADRYRAQPWESWRRIREHHRLHGVERAALRELAAWREQQAMSHDRPRRWILNDAVLMDLARRMPKTLQELQNIRGLPTATSERHGEELLARLAAARADPLQCPNEPRRPKLTPRQAERVDEGLTLIAARANHYAIPLRSVASREDVEWLLAGADSPLRHGWRAALIGRELQEKFSSDGRR
jgi:ribonuclease D